jgi:hypothetical protein
MMIGDLTGLVVFFLTYIVNHFTGGVRFISFQEQLIMVFTIISSSACRPLTVYLHTVGLRWSSWRCVVFVGVHA